MCFNKLIFEAEVESTETAKFIVLLFFNTMNSSYIYMQPYNYFEVQEFDFRKCFAYIFLSFIALVKHTLLVFQISTNILSKHEWPTDFLQAISKLPL